MRNEKAYKIVLNVEKKIKSLKGVKYENILDGYILSWSYKDIKLLIRPDSDFDEYAIEFSFASRLNVNVHKNPDGLISKITYRRHIGKFDKPMSLDEINTFLDEKLNNYIVSENFLKIA